jgi:hypothetical protein
MKRFVAATFVLLLLPCVGAFAQITEEELEAQAPYRYPFLLDFTGAGTRPQGMEFTFIGIADDISALTFNPAGAYGLDKPTFALAYGSYRPTGTFDDQFQMSGIARNQSSFDTDDVFSSVTLAAFAAPVRVKGHPFVAGISYSRTGEEFTSSGNDITDSNYVYLDAQGTITPGLWRQSTNTTYQSLPYVLNIGFGTRLSQDVSFGITGNVYLGEAIQFIEQLTVFEDAPPELLNQLVTVSEYASIRDTSKYSGINFTFGFKYQKPRLTAGLIVKTPYSLETRTNRTFNVVTALNGNQIQGGTIQVHFDNKVSRIKMPLIIGGGLSYKVTDKFILAGDAEYRPYAQTDIEEREQLLIIPGEKDQEIFSQFDPNYRNVLAARVGGEYRWTTGWSWISELPFRAGLSMVPLAQPNVDQTTTVVVSEHPTDPNFDIIEVYVDESFSTAYAYGFSLGFGLRWPQVHLDFGYSYFTYDLSINSTTIGIEYGEVVGEVVQPTDYTGKDSQFNITFIGFFE